MKIHESPEIVPISRLHLDPDNARIHGPGSVKSQKYSLQRFGQTKPIVALRSGKVIDGNGILQAAKELGADQISVVWFDDEKKALEYAIAANRTAELSTWDDKVLAKSLKALQAQGVEGAGVMFTAAEIRKIVAKGGDTQEDVEEDLPPVPEVAKTKTGQLFILGNHRLLCGDAQKPQDVQRLMGGQTADICFTSPPYNLGESMALSGNKVLSKKGNAYQEHDDDQGMDAYTKLLIDSTTQVMSVSRYQFMNIQCLAGNSTAIWELMAFFKNKFVDVMIWDKMTAAPAMAEKVLNSRFEFIFIWTSEKNPNRAIRTAPGFRGTLQNLFQSPPQRANKFSELNGATMPLDVPLRILSDFTTDGAMVCDFFGGTGTTLIAAEKTGRRCRMIEKDPLYCDVIIKRFENATGLKAKLEGE